MGFEMVFSFDLGLATNFIFGFQFGTSRQFFCFGVGIDGFGLLLVFVDLRAATILYCNNSVLHMLFAPAKNQKSYKSVGQFVVRSFSVVSNFGSFTAEACVEQQHLFVMADMKKVVKCPRTIFQESQISTQELDSYMWLYVPPTHKSGKITFLLFLFVKSPSYNSIFSSS